MYSVIKINTDDVEAIPLGHIKSHLRLAQDFNDDDTYILSLKYVALSKVVTFSDIAVIKSTIKETISDYTISSGSYHTTANGGSIFFPSVIPLVSVTEVIIQTEDGPLTLPPEDYTVNTVESAIVFLPTSSLFEETLSDSSPNRLEITYTSGDNNIKPIAKELVLKIIATDYLGRDLYSVLDQNTLGQYINLIQDEYS